MAPTNRFGQWLAVGVAGVVAAAMMLTGVGFTATANAIEPGNTNDSAATSTAPSLDTKTKTTGAPTASTATFPAKTSDIAVADKVTEITEITKDTEIKPSDGVVVFKATEIPVDVMVQIDPGSVVKFDRTEVVVHGSLQVNDATLTALTDDSVGGDTDGVPMESVQAQAFGKWKLTVDGGYLSVRGSTVKYIGADSDFGIKATNPAQLVLADNTITSVGALLGVDQSAVQPWITTNRIHVLPSHYGSVFSGSIDSSYINAVIDLNGLAFGADPTVSSNTFSYENPFDNSLRPMIDTYVRVNSDTCLPDTAVEGNTFTGAVRNVVRIDGIQCFDADKLAGNHVSNAETNGGIYIGTTLSKSTTLPWLTGNAVPEFSYLNGQNTNENGGLVGDGITLTLNPGSYRGGISVGQGGNVMMNGTQSDPVEIDPYWYAHQDDGNTDVLNDNGAMRAKDKMYPALSVIKGGTVDLNHVIMRGVQGVADFGLSGYYSIPTVQISADTVRVKNSVFESSVLNVSENAAQTPVITGNQFINGSHVGVPAVSVASSLIDLNDLAGNTVKGNSNKQLYIRGNAAGGEATLTSSVELPLEGNLIPTVYSELTIPEDKTMQLNKGAVVKFDNSYGQGLIVKGSLLAQGDETNPVVFTSSDDSEIGNDFGGQIPEQRNNREVTVAAGARVELDHVVFKNADTGLFARGLAAATVVNSKFINTTKALDAEAFGVNEEASKLDQYYHGIFRAAYEKFSPINCEPPYTSTIFVANNWYGDSGIPGGEPDWGSSEGGDSKDAAKKIWDGLNKFKFPSSDEWNGGPAGKTGKELQEFLDSYSKAKKEAQDFYDKDMQAAYKGLDSLFDEQQYSKQIESAGKTNTIPYAVWDCSIKAAAYTDGEDMKWSEPYTPVVNLEQKQVVRLFEQYMLSSDTFVKYDRLSYKPSSEWLAKAPYQDTMAKADANADLGYLSVYWQKQHLQYNYSAWHGDLLGKTFDPDTTTYTLTAPYSVSEIYVTPWTADYKATIISSASSIDGSLQQLNVGSNTVLFQVTARDGKTKKTYRIIVNRQKPSADASLANLEVGIGSLTPKFTSKDTDYEWHVPYDMVNGGAVHLTAVTVPGARVDNNWISDPYYYSTGAYVYASDDDNVDDSARYIKLTVIAEDGHTTKDYSIKVITDPAPPVTYTVAFDANGGSAVATQRVEKGKTASKPDDPKRDGYTFDGWYTDKDGGESVDFTAKITGNVTYYAHWTAKPVAPASIAITGDGVKDGKAALLKGASLKLAATVAPDDAADKSVTWSSSNDTVASVDEDGNVTALAAGTAVITATANGDKMITASVTVTVSVQYRTVAFDANGGTATADKQQVEDGQPVAKPADPTRDGYRFTGWTTDRDGKNAYDFAAPVTGDLTLFAQWQDSQAPTITGGGDVTIRQGAAFDPMAGITATDNADGDLTKSVKLTVTDANGNAIASIDTAHPGTYTLTYAVSDQAGNAAKPLVRKLTIAPIIHTVTFDANGGSALDAQQVADGGTVNEPAAPTRAGYAFDGWYTAKDGGDRVVFPVVVTADATYFAHWTKLAEIKPVSIDDVKAAIIQGQTPDLPKTVTVRYSDGTVKAVGVTWNEPDWSAAKPGDVTVDGTVDGVTGLTAKAVVTVAADTSAPVIDVPQDQRDVTIKTGEKFDPMAGITASDNALGDVTGRIKAAITDESGKTVDAIDTAKPGAYTITYTVADAAGNTVTFVRTLVVEAITRTVTFDANGGSTVAAATVEDGKPVAAPADPTRDGYTFAGWTTDRDGKTAYDFAKPVTGDLTLFAQWKAKESGNEPGDNGGEQPGNPEEPNKPGTDQPGKPGENGNQPGNGGSEQPGDNGGNTPNQPGDNGNNGNNDSGSNGSGNNGSEQPGNGNNQTGDHTTDNPGSNGSGNESGDNGSADNGSEQPGTNKPDENWTPLPGDQLTDANRGSISVSSGNATAGKTYRLYVTGLTDCFAQVDAGKTCTLVAYIYSDPVRLLAADGKADTLAVKKDGRDYYVEVTVPAGYSGDHRIALYDGQGDLIGWSPVRVAKQGEQPNGGSVSTNGQGQQNAGNGGSQNGAQGSRGNAGAQSKSNGAAASQVRKLTSTGSAVNVIAGVVVLLLTAAGAVLLARKRR
ncbi:InlB B-repeat-containing protein [Bifidobacterium sp. SO1]|uniref:InlB B-repeat-containing protein n=1 Tax=Bifidobacterium sp. SO1 TaxID=2809029 RepID=UPI001BDCF009|nr:InlB B-repeat-containing protein [Bifidobacterium sp. SO1]MBT1160625.1 InlB B-repeat-containing protein [Bifidobacterium sp. SO1]